MPVYSEFVLGRVTGETRPGLWWNFISATPDLGGAIETARAAATAEGRSAWIETPADGYARL